MKTLSNTLQVAVGSTNRIKVQAVLNGFANEEVTVIPCMASSDVREQPLSEEETTRGAIQRAKNALLQTECDLGIGLEAGVSFLDDKVYLCHIGALVSRAEAIFVANGPLILLPSSFVKPLKEGEVLEELMHKTTGIENLGKKMGAISIFTNNRLTREQVLTQIVAVLAGQHEYYTTLF